MTVDDILRALALFFGLLCLLSGIGFFVAGIAPGPSAPWWKQYMWAAFALTLAYGFLRFALTGWPCLLGTC